MLRVEAVGRDSVTLRWEPPRDTGGVPLSGYIVEQQDQPGKAAAAAAAARWKVAAYVDPARTWWTLAGLSHGSEYLFRVRAENPDGAGQACTLPSAVVPQPAVRESRAILRYTHGDGDVGWRRGVVVSGVRPMNELNARRARLVLGWVTVFGRVYHLGM